MRRQPPPAHVRTRGRRWMWQSCRNHEENRLLLTFGREGGGGCGNRVEITKKTASYSRSDAREAVDVAIVSKSRRKPPPAHVRTRGTRCGYCLSASEVVVAAGVLKWARWRWWQQARWMAEKTYLPLAFGREGGGSSGRRVETSRESHKGGGEGSGALKPP